MDDFDKLLSNMKNQVKPSRWFAMKMRYRIYKKGLSLYWKRQMAAMQAFSWRHAGAFAAVPLVMTGGVGTYAYNSPDVTEGTPLYPVKQGIEEIEGKFANSPEAQAAFHLRKVMRRMAEADTISERLERKMDPAKEENLRKTLDRIEKHLERSLESAAVDHKVEVAERLVGKLKDDFQKIDAHLKMIEGKDHIRRTEIARRSLNKVRQFTKDRIQRFDAVSDEVTEAIRKRHKRIILSRLLRDEIEPITAEPTFDEPIHIYQPTVTDEPIHIYQPIVTDEPVIDHIETHTDVIKVELERVNAEIMHIKEQLESRDLSREERIRLRYKLDKLQYYRDSLLQRQL